MEEKAIQNTVGFGGGNFNQQFQKIFLENRRSLRGTGLPPRPSGSQKSSRAYETQGGTQVRRSDDLKNFLLLSESSRETYSTLMSSAGSGKKSTSAPHSSPRAGKAFPHKYVEQQHLRRKHSWSDNADEPTHVLRARESPSNVTSILPSLSANPMLCTHLSQNTTFGLNLCNDSGIDEGSAIGIQMSKGRHKVETRPFIMVPLMLKGRVYDEKDRQQGGRVRYSQLNCSTPKDIFCMKKTTAPPNLRRFFHRENTMKSRRSSLL